MNKTKISKIIITIVTFLLVVCITTNVFADDGLLDFDGDFPGEGTEQTPNPQPEQTPSGTEEPKQEEPKKEESKTDIPYAGPVEDALMITAFIAFGIIGIYTFVKLSDYSNV